MRGLEDEIFDRPEILSKEISDELKQKYNFHSYLGASLILERKCPDEFADILSVLHAYTITKNEIRSPGGSETEFTRRFGDIVQRYAWYREVRIHADLHIRLTQGRSEADISEKPFLRKNFMHGHFLDFWKGRVAFDFEWNSKDQTYDRDLYAMRQFFEAGLIDVGVIVTRDLSGEFFKSLGFALDKQGNETGKLVAAKFGASTTGMAKLVTRVASGRSGGCPILAVGIAEATIID